MEKIFLVIIHYRDQQLTQRCLESLVELKSENFVWQTVVVNNNPLENLKQLESKFKNNHFYKTKTNLGFSGGNNFGIKIALEKQADWVLLLNNDTVVDPGLLIQLLAATKSDKKIGILGPKIYFAPGREYHQKRYTAVEKGKVFWYAGGLIDWKNIYASHRGVDEVDCGQYNQSEETDFVSGCAMLVKKEVFDKIGLLDDRYFLYLEDIDFCQRTRNFGFKVVFVPTAKLWHVNAGSSEVGGPLHDYFLTRNRMLFGMKYASLRTKLNLIQESFKLLLFGRSWQKTAIKDFYLRKFGKGSWHG